MACIYESRGQGVFDAFYKSDFGKYESAIISLTR